MSEKTWTLCKSTIRDVSNHFNQLDPSFYNSLVKRINLDEYIDKLKSKAKTIEYWEEKRLVGLIAFYINETKHRIFISNFTVVHDRTSRGIGRELFDKFMQELRKSLDTFEIELEVQKTNRDAIQFYQSLGFKHAFSNTDSLSMIFYYPHHKV